MQRGAAMPALIHLVLDVGGYKLHGADTSYTSSCRSRRSSTISESSGSSWSFIGAIMKGPSSVGTIHEFR